MEGKGKEEIENIEKGNYWKRNQKARRATNMNLYFCGNESKKVFVKLDMRQIWTFAGNVSKRWGLRSQQ